MANFELLTTAKLPEVEQIHRAFDEKHRLECLISKMIKDYEEETGLAIDMIHYQRDITLPIRGARYTSLNIIITAEETERNLDGKEQQ